MSLRSPYSANISTLMARVASLSPAIIGELTTLQRDDAIALLRCCLPESAAASWRVPSESSASGDGQERVWDDLAQHCVARLADLLGLDDADIAAEITLSPEQSDRWDEVIAGLLSPGAVRS